MKAGTSVTLKSYDFHFSELLELVRTAASEKTAIIIEEDNNLTAAEAIELGHIAHGQLKVDLTGNTFGNNHQSRIRPLAVGYYWLC